MQKALKQLLFGRFGYNLIVETSFARLIVAGLDARMPPRAALRSTEQHFTPRHCTYLALTCSALLSPTVGEQAGACVDRPAAGSDRGDPQGVRVVVWSRSGLSSISRNRRGSPGSKK